MAFSNPIIGGNGNLVREQIKSPDYVAGVSGWIIRKDGTAEFNDIIVRGELYVTDPDGSYIRAYDENPGSGVVIEFGLPTDVGLTRTPGYIHNDLDPEPGLEIVSPTVNGTPTARIGLIADTTDDISVIELSATNLQFISENNVTITTDTLHVEATTGDGDVVIDGNVNIAGNLTVTGVGPETYIEKNGAQNFTNTTVMADITDMSFTAEPNFVYEIRLRAAIGGPTAADVKLAWTVPAGAQMSRNILAASAAGLADNQNTTMTNIRRGAGTQQSGGTSGGTANDFTGWWEDTILKVAGTGGTVQLQGAQNAANVTPTVFQDDSWMIVRRVA